MKEEYFDRLENMCTYLGEVKEQIDVILQDYLATDINAMGEEDLKIACSATKTILSVLFRTLVHEHKEFKDFIENK